MSARTASPFSRRSAIALIVFGGAVFVALLYLLGMGEPNRDANDGGAHALGKGLTGYAALVELLEASGQDVDISRDAASLTDESLLVLTPPLGADAEDIQTIIEDRRYVGPTMLVLPKWRAMRVPPGVSSDAEDGWVILAGSQSPEWLSQLDALPDGETRLDKDVTRWSGLGYSGRPVAPNAVQSISGNDLVALVRDDHGQMLAGYLDDGSYPDLAKSAGRSAVYDDRDDDQWPIVVVAEPDLLNNYGFSQRSNGEAGRALVLAALDGYDLPIVFDTTLNGLGGTQNLLTLAFTPPFLAATLCLILAGIVVGWRAFNRFGPPLAEARAIAFGKRQLVANSAALIQRARRPHLLADPYARLMRYRIAKRLGLRERGEPGEVEAAIDETLNRRQPDEPSFSSLAAEMRGARGPNELLRAARALKSLERTIKTR